MPRPQMKRAFKKADVFAVETLNSGPLASRVSEVDLLSRVLRGRIEYIAYDNRRARPAIVNVPGFVNLPPVRGQLKRSAHFPAPRTFFIGDELSAVPVGGYLLQGIVFRFLNFPAVRVAREFYSLVIRGIHLGIL